MREVFDPCIVMCNIHTTAERSNNAVTFKLSNCKVLVIFITFEMLLMVCVIVTAGASGRAV